MFNKMDKELLIRRMKQRIELGKKGKISLILKEYGEHWRNGNPLSPSELRHLLERDTPDKSVLEWEDFDGELLHIDDVMDLCLDKQKVKEVIDNHILNCEPHLCCADELKKELKLE